MKDILDLRKVERIIEDVARRFIVDGLEFEDLVQIGRISVWNLLKKYDINETNVDGYAGLIRNSVKYGLLNELVKSKAKKRIELTKAVSLDEKLDEEDDERTLQNFLPSDEENGLDILERNENDRKRLKFLVRNSFAEKTVPSKRAVIFFLVKMLGLSESEIPKSIRYETFLKFGISRWLWIFFNNSPFRALNLAYPGKFLPYEMSRIPKKQWDGLRGRKRAEKALKLALEKTGYAPEYFPRLLSYHFFVEFGLVTPLKNIFGYDRFSYLDATFPSRYHAWDLSFTQRGFFDSSDHLKDAVRWLVKKKLGYDIDNLSVHEIWEKRVATKIVKEDFCQNGLRGVMAIYKSPEPVLRLTYPGKFLPWSFQRRDKWYGRSGKALAALATRWVIERYANISPLSSGINYDFFVHNGLQGMITARSLGFNSSPKRALRNAYPKLFL